MKKILIVLPLVLILFLMPNYSFSLSYDLNYVFSGTINTPSPYATIEINGITGGVEFTLYNKTAGTQSGSSKLTEFYFNYKGSSTLTFTPPSGWGLTYAPNSRKADGDGYFDFELDSNQGNIYVAVGTPLKFRVYGDDNPLNFFDLSVTKEGEGFYHFAAHIQALADPSGGSAWVGDKVKVPEPGILILLGIAMTAVGVATRYVRKP